MDRFKFKANIKKFNQIVEVGRIDFKEKLIYPSTYFAYVYDNKNKNNILYAGSIEEADKYYKKNPKKTTYRSSANHYYFNEINLMQSIGLKDKNGKLIYEGNIVKIKGDYHRYLGYIKWCKECLAYDLVVGEEKKDFISSMERFCRLQREGKITIEIKGNIYTNPELLTNKEETK